MKRIRVVGNAGSGKTTVARAIARRLEVDHLELDDVHWMADWTERDVEEFRAVVADFATRPGWVIDGNYRNRLGDLLDDRVDAYVWLDLPRWRVTWSVLARTLRRGISGETLWASANRERLGSLLRRDPRENIVLWSWTQHRRYRAEYAAEQDRSPLPWFRLRSRRQVRRFLEGLGPTPEPGAGS